MERRKGFLPFLVVDLEIATSSTNSDGLFESLENVRCIIGDKFERNSKLKTVECFGESLSLK